MAEQQGKLVQPINAVGIKVDQMSQSFTALQTSMDETNRRLAQVDKRLATLTGGRSAATQPVPGAPVSNP